ncbi:UDP-perosamine 4-acetyltransferase [Cohnella sp. OV330]|uniref:acetyltransferase n=1 Tax=Cohnella sp. OV330 TaxID=1855288 RepID=UPI0008DFA5F7|nr:acetyltransferase [Cohnella sp. OV330]SFB47831.1 UDP-perosamine 4-acetyltransferase [Cohnella sp. OV330]
MKKIIVIGNGGHARVVVDTLLQLNRDIIGFTDIQDGPNIFNLCYLGDDQRILDYSPDEVELANGIGSARGLNKRRQIFDSFTSKGYKFTQVIHPTAVIGAHVRMGDGVQILANATVQTFGKIGNNSLLNTSAIVEHDCKIGDHCHLAPRSVVCGNVQIGDTTFIGAGAIILPDLSLGNDVIIGAGSVVTKDIIAGSKGYGVPFRSVDLKQNRSI